jgi:RNA polymerase sigma-70 factor, ECF subfamily
VTEVSHDRSPCRSAGGTPGPGEDWIAELTSEGSVREDALRRLHALLLRAARFQVSRMSAMRAAVGPAQIEDIINLAADEAMVAVLGKLATFEGRSRFTTWAYNSRSCKPRSSCAGRPGRAGRCRSTPHHR